MVACAAVTVPEMVAACAWWTVILVAPTVLFRRHRHRRGLARKRRSTLPHVINRQRRRSAAACGEEQPRAAAVATPEYGRAGDHGLTSPRAPIAAPAAHLPLDALEPLCQYVDFQRRLELAAGELRCRLERLPAGEWRIEPYPLTGERRNTFLILGKTGIFVVSATYAPGHWDDVITASRLASKIQALLPGYDGQVQAAICYPFAATQPRVWYRADDHGDWIGAWVMGGDSLIRWLEHFGPDYGVTPADLARFDAMATPNWLTQAIPTRPSWPELNETPSADADE
jgi:hypothetical protein